MNKRLVQVIGAIVALAMGLLSYAIVSGHLPLVTTAQARSVTMPANPQILYIAPQGVTRGWVNEQAMQTRGAKVLYDWTSAQSVASQSPVDGVLVDASLFKSMSNPERSWLLAQFHQGVALVSLGLEDDEFTRVLGLQTLLAPAEGFNRRGPTGYRLVRAIAVGTPDDLRILEASNWVQRAIQGGTDTPNNIKRPLFTSFVKTQGKVDSAQELDLLFFQLRSAIEGAYKIRAEFQDAMKNFKGN
ncbi:MAG: hypothetical protein HZB51_14850 [Chloroflexi bacterium]|nr:hypothetical protein [Chloroflexota bacterium]